jgi:hypothetical protein
MADHSSYRPQATEPLITVVFNSSPNIGFDQKLSNPFGAQHTTGTLRGATQLTG